MNRVVKIVLVIDVIDVDLVVIAPAYWPRINQFKPVAAVLKAGTVVDDYRAVDAEVVFSAEMLMEMFFRDASMVSHRPPLRLGTPARVVVTSLAITIALIPLLFFLARLLLGPGVLFLNFLGLTNLVLLIFLLLLGPSLIFFLDGSVILLSPPLLLLHSSVVFLCLSRVILSASLGILWRPRLLFGLFPLLGMFLPGLRMLRLGLFLPRRLCFVRLLRQTAD